MSSPYPVPASLLDSGADDTSALFGQFVAEVARAQLDEWLPARPSLILDLSLAPGRYVGLMVARGHRVVHADPYAARRDIGGTEVFAGSGAGRLHTVCGDARRLDWLAGDSVDAVVAEGGMLSESLAAELTLDAVHRVLRPGGALLMCVDSLVSGLARLADQGCWAELADVPSADVVLIPSGDGHISRCFWPEELHGMLDAAGFDTDWICPRTVLSEQTVIRALRVDPGRLGSLVTTELRLSRSRPGESLGSQLVVSAHRR